MMFNRTIMVVVAVVFLNLLYNAFLPLHFDEAYYWLWSKNVALSYYDHPPMVAWLLRLVSFIGESEWVLRLVPFVSMSIVGLIVWRLAYDAFGQRVAVLAILSYLAFPIVHIAFMLATPDAPVNLFWALTLYASYRALFPKVPGSSSTGWLIMAGLFFGCALLSKYTAVILLPALLLAVLFSSRQGVLFSWGMVGAVVVATLVFLPVIVWNYQNDWASFAFQFNHGIAEKRVFNSSSFLDFLGGQIGVLSPLFFLGLLYALVRFLPENFRDDKLAFFFWPCALPLAFFGYAAMFKPAGANWPVSAYISGVVLLSYWAVRKDWRVWRLSSFALAIFLLLVLKAPMLFPFLPPRAVLLGQLNGEPQVFSRLEVPSGVTVLADSYKSASLAAYYIPNKPPVQVLLPARKSMFDFWQKAVGANLPERAVFVGRSDEGERLKRLFAKVQRADEDEVGGSVSKKIFV